ncbi:MAG: glutamate synthase [Thermoplasmata archaeon]|nr:glutamate synthase [Thermoplasmata archaeon]
MNNDARTLTEARAWMQAHSRSTGTHMQEAEGGCGVVGIVSTAPVAGRHIFEPLIQMHNRGNGKGGGIAAVGLDADQLGVTQRILEQDYLLQVAYLKPEVRDQLEDEFIKPNYRVERKYKVETSTDPALLKSLEVTPPEVWRYFCRAKKDALEAFVAKRKLGTMDPRKAEDEFVYQTSFAINVKYYASSGMSAFVMSHGRNMLVMKIVGYAEDVIRYYKLDEMRAHIWIGHQRYPTKGRVWHPGGAHPFVGLDEALVHNGDFANYHTVSEYLGQRNIVPLFLTDTEVSVLLFDLLNRTYGYPLEYIIESLAPTTERDFHLLPEAKRRIYRAIQATHIHGSPDGPWLFIIGRNCFYDNKLQLMGITDTSMLRPQVFALVDGDVQIGLIASEKQAIDSVLSSISREMPTVPKYADRYWNARGGSHTDGGAFILSLYPEAGAPGKKRLICTNKFGTSVTVPQTDWSRDDDIALGKPFPKAPRKSALGEELAARKDPEASFNLLVKQLGEVSGEELNSVFSYLVKLAGKSDVGMDESVALLTLMLDRRYPTGKYRRSRLVQKANECLDEILRSAPRVDKADKSLYSLVDLKSREKLKGPSSPYSKLAIDCAGFPMEGEEGVSFVIKRARELGWTRVLAFAAHGQRFFGCSLGPKSKGFRIDAYGSPGDYLASGLDGAEVHVHTNGQDQLGQILANGKFVVYGDVGQTFLYGAKGGETYVMGNAAGRPLINAVGKPKVVINGTCLDYLAESFMAGNPLYGGGFVVLNGIAFDHTGSPYELPEPYPGGNLFSLASGGAIYVRDPRRLIGEDQLNGGRITKLTEADWNLILPYLKENERLFGFSVDDFLLKVDGVRKAPDAVYRKIEPAPRVTLAGKVQEQDVGGD